MIGARVTHVVTPVFPSSVCCLCSRACVLPGLGGVCARLRSPRTALCFGVLTLCVRPVSVTVTCVRVCVSPHMPAPCVYFLSRRACSCGIWHIARFLRPGYSLWLCGCSVVLCYLSALYCYRVCHLCTCAAVSLPDARAPPQGTVVYPSLQFLTYVLFSRVCPRCHGVCLGLSLLLVRILSSVGLAPRLSFAVPSCVGIFLFRFCPSLPSTRLRPCS